MAEQEEELYEQDLFEAAKDDSAAPSEEPEYTYGSLNEEQKRIFDLFKEGKNIFITGDAGTGKSYLLNTISRYCEATGIGLVKVAPTGVAANNIGGATIHYQFKMKAGIDFGNPKKTPAFLNDTDTLIVDEISMVRLDLFDKLMKFVGLGNASRARKNKKPIQLIFCGDFFQLAPVVNKEMDKPLLDEFYGCDTKGAYAFQSRYWNLYDVKLCNLTTIMRQEDGEFCAALNMCKYGNMDCIGYFRSRSAKREVPDAIWVCGTNASVNARNASGLAKVDGKLLTSQAEYHGCEKKDGLCEDMFQYKIGARVVLLANDKEGCYQNGSLGTIVKKVGATIMVKLDESDETVPIDKVKFPKCEYVNQEKDVGVFDSSGSPVFENGKHAFEKRTIPVLKEIGYAKQYPLRLGYAVTVHKSQGQTYDAMNFEPRIFANGQLYVALSRCKNIDKLYISGMLTQRMVMTAPEVLEFARNSEKYSFFDAEKMKQITVPEKYAGKIAELVKLWKTNEVSPEDIPVEMPVKKKTRKKKSVA
jgi:hypothetical protein